MTKVVKHNQQQSFSNNQFIKIGNVTKAEFKLGYLRASKRCQLKRTSNGHNKHQSWTNDKRRLVSNCIPKSPSSPTKSHQPSAYGDGVPDTDYKHLKPSPTWNSNAAICQNSLTSRNHVQSICKPSLIDKDRLQALLFKEFYYHPNNAFLYHVNPQLDDKVDVVLRNEAVHNLRFLHNAFFNLSTETFCKAINLVDRFIVKVKDIVLPDLDTMVRITHCGGNSADLLRMKEILASKLSHDLNGVNAFDFLQSFVTCVVRDEDDLSTSDIQLLSRRLNNLMEIALCSLEVYQYRPACLALGIMVQAGISGLRALADLCDIDWFDVCDCAGLVSQLYETYYRNPLPRNNTGLILNTVNYVCGNGATCRRSLGLTRSKNRFRIGYSSPTPLDTISEDYEPVDEDDWLLPLLFEH